MFDHVCLEVSDFEKSKLFYIPIMKFLGFKVWVEGDDHIGFGTNERTHFWLNEAAHDSVTKNVHIAFPSQTREDVNEFYKIALKSGGISEGAPGLRPEYHKDYYGAFVLDPDGNNIEAVCHKHFL